ncbi:MAG: acetyl/propionyl/methylcrotonyl-CoA carboxylase subunit alpha [Alphaproteobacteria bacterium]
MFSKILIANRGEIACRVMATAKRLGVATVAVYSDADVNALHVLQADEAIAIGPAPARESYLNGQAILAAAEQTGAEAIHPGYGFLSENADFADACAQAGRVFIGPPSDAIRSMGSKRAAKALMTDAGVPLLPGYHGERQDLEALTHEAEQIGYPVLVKASAGGGGRGMRVVNSVSELADAVEGAKREALAAFGDDSMLLEKYLTSSRHIESQIFFDQHGNGVHLFERDCSIQRRYQKVIEEAPAPGMQSERRAEIGAAAIAAARAVNYVGAGTVEFIAGPDGAFYFMEMNTRLQVEHPVTEMVTGIDLVEWQLRIAGGAPLPCSQDQLTIDGHAIEARIYAEDPRRDFLPSVGELAHLRLPVTGTTTRIDAGVQLHAEVSMHYDPMLAKVIVKGPDREQAVSALAQALSECEVVGVTSNIGFLAAIARHPEFSAGGVDTQFIGRNETSLREASDPHSETLLALAVLAVVLHRNDLATEQRQRSTDPNSPWHSQQSWRLNETGQQRIALVADKVETVAIARYQADGAVSLELPSGTVRASITRQTDSLRAVLDGCALSFSSVFIGADVFVFHAGVRGQFQLLDDNALAGAEHAGDDQLLAPMPGTVVAVHVATGETVTSGTPLMVLEAMKMEHTIVAPHDGVITAVHYKTGDQVAEEGAELLVLEPTND